MNKFGILFIGLLLTVMGCEKDKVTSTVPEMEVNFEFRPEVNIKLNTVGGYESFDRYGYGGVFVYRYGDMDYFAYDKACPYDYLEGRRVTFNPLDLTFECAACGAKYGLYNGGFVLNMNYKMCMRAYKVVPTTYGYLVTN